MLPRKEAPAVNNSISWSRPEDIEHNRSVGGSGLVFAVAGKPS